MKRRTMFGLLAVPLAGLVVGGGAIAWAHGGGGRHGVMKRFVASMIDDVLDQAQATPEQRTQIHGVRDRVFATFEAHRKDRGAHMEEALTLFTADQPDPARLEAFRAQHEAEHRKLADAIQLAIAEVHDILTPAQRQVVADYVRAHHRRHMD